MYHLNNVFKIFVFISLFIFFCSSSVADNSQLHLLSKEKRDKKVDQLKSKAQSLLRGNNRRIDRINKLLSRQTKESTQTAIISLNKIAEDSKSNGSQTVEASFLLGNAYASIEDFPKSIKNFEKFLENKEASFNRFQSTLIILSQLYLISKNIQKSKDYLLSWFSITEKEVSRPYALLATINYMEKDTKQALVNISKAISLSKEPEKKWLSFAASLNFEFKNYKKAEEVLAQLVALYPESQMHWEQLSITKFEQNKSTETLASFQIASKIKPFTKEVSIIQHTSLLSEQGIPYLAGKNLDLALKEKKIKINRKNYEILGDFWMQAREWQWALEAYKQSAALAKKDGKIFMKLSRLYLFQEQWAEAIKYMTQGLKLGGIKKPDEVYFQIGWSYYELKKYTKSLEYFGKAIDLQGDYEIPSRKWIRQIKASLS